MLKKSPYIFDAAFEISKLIRGKSDLVFTKKGESIFTEGSTPLGIYFIDKGKVKISKLGCQGKKQILKINTKNEMLGVLDLLCNSKHNNSAIALEDATLSFVSKKDFLKLLLDKPLIMEHFLKNVSRELTLAQSRLVHFAYKPVRGRLADAIFSLDEIFNRHSNENQPILINRLDLAGYVGSAQETISRLLSEFKADKLVNVQGSKIEIRDMDGLKKISIMYN